MALSSWKLEFDLCCFLSLKPCQSRSRQWLELRICTLQCNKANKTRPTFCSACPRAYAVEHPNNKWQRHHNTHLSADPLRLSAVMCSKTHLGFLVRKSKAVMKPSCTCTASVTGIPEARKEKYIYWQNLWRQPYRAKEIFTVNMPV